MKKRAIGLVAVGIAISGGRLLAAVDADARRGAEFFEKQKCNTCHSVSGAGGGASNSKAPDLGIRSDREYTPSSIASRMWNHAPAMWSEMAQSGMKMPSVSEQDAADLFAFFYAARYFEKAGDAGRGKRVFSEKHCSECHALAVDAAKTGPPVSQWQSLRDPIALVQRMWNHLPQMQQAAGKRKLSWPELTNQDLTDVLVYLQTLPEMHYTRAEFNMPVNGNGKAVFDSKGCANCHKGRLSLEQRLTGRTLTGIAADMWNHGPRMKEPGITLTEDEMRQLLGYLWGNNFFAAHGNAGRGRRVFESKRCGTCHDQGVAPKIAGNPSFSDITLVSALWKHGPQMLSTLRQKNMQWPQFTPAQMSDLVAYLAKPEAK